MCETIFISWFSILCLSNIQSVKELQLDFRISKSRSFTGIRRKLCNRNKLTPYYRTASLRSCLLKKDTSPDLMVKDLLWAHRDISNPYSISLGKMEPPLYMKCCSQVFYCSCAHLHDLQVSFLIYNVEQCWPRRVGRWNRITRIYNVHDTMHISLVQFIIIIWFSRFVTHTISIILCIFLVYY